MRLSAGTLSAALTPDRNTDTDTLTVNILNHVRAVQPTTVEAVKHWMVDQFSISAEDAAASISGLVASGELVLDGDGLWVRGVESSPQARMTAQQERLIADAENVGMSVKRDKHGVVIRRRRPSLAIRVWPDGCCTREDVSMDLAKRMTQREARDCLGI